MGNAGEARLDVVAMGRDEVSAVMNKVSGELDALKARLAGYEKAQNASGKAALDAARQLQTFGEQTGNVAAPLRSAASLSEVLNTKLTGVGAAIVGGLVGSVSGGVLSAIQDLVGGLGGLVLEFLKTEPRLDALSASMIATANDAAKFSSQITGMQIAASAAQKQMQGFGVTIANLGAQIAKLQGLPEIAAEWEKAAQVAATGDTIKSLEQSMADTEIAANEARRTVVDLQVKVEKARLDSQSAQEMIAYRASLGLDTTLQRQQAGLAAASLGLLTAELARTRNAYTDAADAVEKMAEQLAYLDRLQSEQAKKHPAKPPVPEVVTPTPRPSGGRGTEGPRQPLGLPVVESDQPGSYIREGGDQPLPNVRDTANAEANIALAEMRDKAGNLANAFYQVRDAVQDLARTSFPELVDAMAEIEGISTKVHKAQIDVATGIALGSEAVVANAAKAIGGVRAEAAVRAAFEVGMGFATLANPFESAGHFTAAALLGAVAGGAGKGSRGGEKRSGDSGGASGSSSSGASFEGDGGAGVVVNNVHNYQMGFGDRQTMIEAQRQGERRARGTGIGAGAGV